MTSTEATELLRGAGLRVTRPRLAVMSALGEHPHADVDTLAGTLRSWQVPVSTQAIYDVLHVLQDYALVRVIEPAGHSTRYELRVGDNHHHLVCRVCGDVRDVDCAAGRRPCLDVVDDFGFVIDEAEVTYWGLCPECAQGSIR